MNISLPLSALTSHPRNQYDSLTALSPDPLLLAVAFLREEKVAVPVIPSSADGTCKPNSIKMAWVEQKLGSNAAGFEGFGRRCQRDLSSGNLSAWI